MATDSIQNRHSFKPAFRCLAVSALIACIALHGSTVAAEQTDGAAFFERRIRPLLIEHCYECHSEQAGTREGGLLLDRERGWLQGGNTGKAVVPGEPKSSLLITAISHTDDTLQMPPDYRLTDRQVELLTTWIRRDAPGPRVDIAETAFSQLGDQDLLFGKALQHWAFQPLTVVDPPEAANDRWNRSAIDRFLHAALTQERLTPSPPADPRTLFRRLHYDLTGLPPTWAATEQFVAVADQDRPTAIKDTVDQLLNSQAFGEHIGRMWLDVARYADTDSAYRPDTKTPHYFPFAFTYRDYVIAAFNDDKPVNQFIREQLAVDLMDFADDAPEQAAIGFLTDGPHVQRNPADAIDDWIDVTTRGLMGITVACARCHDHKYEPVPTVDYYSLHGVFASVTRIAPLDETRQPLLTGYTCSEADRQDYLTKRAAIDKKINGAGSKKVGNNNRSIAQKIRETELAELLTFHPGAPTHTMTVQEKPRPVTQFVYLRGDPRNRGPQTERRFLKVLDHDQAPFTDRNSGRLELAEKIVSPGNPLTARVFVNRVWGFLMGSHLVKTASNFGLQGEPPSHPELLDWLTADFIANGWSTKHLVRKIVMSGVYQQRSRHRGNMVTADPENRLQWRANRKRLSIEATRDSLLAISGQLDSTLGGRAQQLWGDNYTKRRAVYGFVNRFNLDPTLRVFDFPSPMQTQPGRGESIVAPQALFTMNSQFVIDQSVAVTELGDFKSLADNVPRIAWLFKQILLRPPVDAEMERVMLFAKQQRRMFAKTKRPDHLNSLWPLVAQSLMMSNEFQYVD